VVTWLPGFHQQTYEQFRYAQYGYGNYTISGSQDHLEFTGTLLLTDDNPLGEALPLVRKQADYVDAKSALSQLPLANAVEGENCQQEGQLQQISPGVPAE
jgi:hypothetical protein